MSSEASKARLRRPDVHLCQDAGFDETVHRVVCRREASAVVIARGVPGWADETVTDLAKLATVRQLSTVVNQYSFEPEPGADPDKKVRRQIRFGAVDEHRWRMILENHR